VQHYARLDVSHNTSNGYIDRQEHAMLERGVLVAQRPYAGPVAPRPGISGRTRRQPVLGHAGAQPQRRRVEDRQTQPLQQLQRRGRAHEQRTIWVRSIIDYRINDSTTLRNTLYHLDSQRDYRNLETYQYNADNSAVNRSTAYQVRHRVSRTATIRTAPRQQVFGLDTTWSGGFEYKVNQTTNSPLNIKGASTVDPNNYRRGISTIFPAPTRR
jgi:iron complex outermembrane receptor protein